MNYDGNKSLANRIRSLLEEAVYLFFYKLKRYPAFRNDFLEITITSGLASAEALASLASLASA